jgi:hypothetical protein
MTLAFERWKMKERDEAYRKDGNSGKDPKREGPSPALVIAMLFVIAVFTLIFLSAFSHAEERAAGDVLPSGAPSPRAAESLPFRVN